MVVVEASIGWLLVEWAMADWGRIPFTCSYIPVKGFVPHIVVKGFASYLVFSLASVLILRLSLAVVFALMFGAAAALGVQRARRARLAALMFEDELPSDVTPLRLNAD